MNIKNIFSWSFKQKKSYSAEKSTPCEIKVSVTVEWSKDEAYHFYKRISPYKIKAKSSTQEMRIKKTIN